MTGHFHLTQQDSEVSMSMSPTSVSPGPMASSATLQLDGQLSLQPVLYCRGIYVVIVKYRGTGHFMSYSMHLLVQDNHGCMHITEPYVPHNVLFHNN